MTEIWNLSAICRCCHSDGHFKSLGRTYVVKNDVEIYSSMLRDTFGIVIEPPAGEISYSICDLCIHDLRKASQFKKQVLICESKFEEYCKNEEAQQIQPDDIKVELDSIDDEFDRENFYDGFEDTDEKKVSLVVKDEDKQYIKKGIEDIKQEDDAEKKVEVSIKTKKPMSVKPKRRKTANPIPQRKTKTIPQRTKTIKLENIIKSENKDSFSCKICGKTYKHLQTIKRHVCGCKTCDIEFENTKDRSLHMATHKLTEHTCNICGKSYPSKQTYNYNRHMNSHTKATTFICDYCDKVFLFKRSLLNHINNTHLGLSIRKVICDICGHTFNDVTNMRVHVKTVHEKLRPFKCSVCPRDFTAKKHLVVHVRREHTGERPYACDLCSKAYACSQELKKHKIVFHSGKVPAYTCKLCQAELKNRSALNRHMRTHSGSKPLLCHLCNRDFSCKYSLRRHIMYHSGEKRFQCGICLKRFPEKFSLIRHNDRFHSGKVVEKKQCHLCKRQVADLEKHIAVHNNKPHSCDYCSKRYSKRNALNRHIANIHFGRKAHPCDLCDHKYVNLRTLLNHKLKVHKIESKIEKDEGLNDYAGYLNDVNKKNDADVKIDLST